MRIFLEFSVDGDLQYHDTIIPGEWTWSGFGEYTVTATAYDKARNLQSQSISAPYSYNLQKLFNAYQIQGYAVKYQLNM